MKLNWTGEINLMSENSLFVKAWTKPQRVLEKKKNVDVANKTLSVLGTHNKNNNMQKKPWTVLHFSFYI